MSLRRGAVLGGLLAFSACITTVGCGGDDSSQNQMPGADSGSGGAAKVDGATGDSGGMTNKDSGTDAPTPDSGMAGGDAGDSGNEMVDGGDGGGNPDSGNNDGGTADGGGDGGPGMFAAFGASALVSGGQVSHSANYTLVGSLGQSPGGNNTSKSPNFQLRGGVVGATQGQ